jgi:hypothetical protein
VTVSFLTESLPSLTLFEPNTVFESTVGYRSLIVFMYPTNKKSEAGERELFGREKTFFPLCSNAWYLYNLSLKSL